MNAKKIFLLYPPSNTIVADGIRRKSNNRFPPIDLMYLASIAVDCGYETKIKDFGEKNEFINDLTNFNPDFILANVRTSSFLPDIKFLEEIKMVLPGVKIIVKGVPFFAYNSNVIYENPFIDYVIYSEAEMSLKEILSELPNNEIPGICYLKNFQCIKNEKRTFNINLDKLPFPSRNLIDNSQYINPYNNKIQTVINISRGCPYNCFHCLATSINGDKVRVRSIENIIEEIKECVENYNIKDFFFYADIFNFNNSWLLELCNCIIEKKLKITWMADFLPQNIDEDLAKLLYKSGCRYANLGIESASEEILNQIGKNYTLNEVKNIIQILKRNKINTIGSFVIGLPYETEETAEKTLKFSLECGIDYANFYSAVPLPGTKYFGYAMLKRLADNNLDFGDAYIKPVIRSHKLSKEKIAKLIDDAYIKFNMRPKIFLRYCLNKLSTLINSII